MNRDWNATKKRYLQFDQSHRLGHLASNLARIQSLCDHPLHEEVAFSVVEESQYLIEWITPETNGAIGSELTELQQVLSDWQHHWSALWASDRRLQVANQAKDWSNRLLEHSGLLIG